MIGIIKFECLPMITIFFPKVMIVKGYEGQTVQDVKKKIATEMVSKVFMIMHLY